MPALYASAAGATLSRADIFQQFRPSVSCLLRYLATLWPSTHHFWLSRSRHVLTQL